MDTRDLHRATVLALLAGLALVAPAVAMAQDATVADPRRADAASVHPVAPDVTLRTRVADSALLQASRRFDALDANGDGLLDRSDVDPASFDRLDGDHDGRLDRDEYTAQARR